MTENPLQRRSTDIADITLKIRSLSDKIRLMIARNPDFTGFSYAHGLVGNYHEVDWWWTQSGANQSLQVFPDKQGKCREILIILCRMLSLPLGNLPNSRRYVENSLRPKQRISFQKQGKKREEQGTFTAPRLTGFSADIGPQPFCEAFF